MTTFPLDFDIFFRSGSRIHPLIEASAHGGRPCSWCERTIVANSHVLMISGPCGRRSIGKVRANRSGSSSQPHTICGVSDDVAQVSMMSGSPANPPGAPRWSAVKPGGTSLDGSMGSVDSSGRIRSSRSTVPSAPIRYHSGNGTPKKRWRLISQSPFSPSTQLS